MEDYMQIDIKSKGKVGKNNKEINGLVCAFCGKKYVDEKDSGLNFLISPLNKNIGICDVCLDTFYETNRILRESNAGEIEDSKENMVGVDIGKMEDYTPRTIKEKLDQYVIGQEDAKKALAIAAYNHIKRVNNIDLNIEKTNVLLAGPSGCGKTYLVQKLADILQVPCVSINITAYSETGYKGKDLLEILRTLYYKANRNVALAERGIVFIDEIDKIAGNNNSSTAHINDTGLQQGLLKLIEGCKEEFSDNEFSAPIMIDTKNILFIFAGAFVGIEEFQKGNETSMGFASKNVSKKQKPTLKKVTSKQLISYGMIPEFIGRVPKIITLKALNKDDLIDIMKNSKDSAILQYQKLLELDGYDLEFSEDALDEIAEQCVKANLGARSLKGIIEETMSDILFDGPRLNKRGRVTKKKEKIVITREMIKEHEDMFTVSE